MRPGGPGPALDRGVVALARLRAVQTPIWSNSSRNRTALARGSSNSGAPCQARTANGVGQQASGRCGQTHTRPSSPWAFTRSRRALSRMLLVLPAAARAKTAQQVASGRKPPPGRCGKPTPSMNRSSRRPSRDFSFGSVNPISEPSQEPFYQITCYCVERSGDPAWNGNPRRMGSYAVVASFRRATSPTA
jgi:hypothetical protein